MNGIGILILVLIGIFAIVLDLLVIPGIFVGILGGCFIAAGVIMGYVQYGALTGNLILVGTIILTIVSIVLMLRSKTWRRLILNTTIESKMNEIDTEKITIGVEGISVSRLAPSGKAQFGDELVEVTSAMGFIDQQTKIKIINIEGNKITVQPLEH